MTICPIYKQSLNNPHLIAISGEENTLTYLQLEQAIQKKCHELAGPMKIYPFIATKSLHSIILLFALFRLHRIAFPLNPTIPKPNSTIFLKEPFSQEPGLNDFDQPDAALLLLTSGSTKEPKEAVLSFDNLYWSAKGSLECLNLVEGDTYLLSLPLYHVGGVGILFRTFLAGATLILTSLSLENALRHYLVSHLSLVPTQLYRLIKKQRAPFPSLKTILLGGAPIGHFLYEKATLQGLPLKLSYGLTEMSALVTCSNTPLFSMGTTLPYRQLKTSPKKEIMVKGKTLFLGYRHQSQTTLSTNNEGWFSTGDLGELVDGHLHILGRKDNLFISGGENIHPEEIEEAITRLPGIIQAVVVPKDDPEWGARPIAFISEEKTGTYSLESLREQLSEILPKYKLPIDLQHLPNLSQMKISRAQLKAACN
jgi:O-succinylbenzoic acid--CoA ligase